MKGYELDICDIVKREEFRKNVIAYGFTSTVFKSPDSNYVIKEIYLPTTSGPKYIKRINEVNMNLEILKSPELKQIIVPFLGYQICDNTLYLKFKYIPSTFGSMLLTSSVKEIKYIYYQVLKLFKIFHKYATHNDLNVNNIFIQKTQKGPSKIYFGDLATSYMVKDKYLKNKDIKTFKDNLKENIMILNLFKLYSVQDIFKILKEDNLLEKFNQMYEAQDKWILETFPERPKWFLDKIQPEIFKNFLMRFIRDNYKEKLYWDRLKFSPEMEAFLKSL